MPAWTVGRTLLRGVSVAAVFLAPLGSELSGQVVPSAGSRVRVSTDSVLSGRWTTGQYIALNHDLLRLVSAEGDTVNVPRPAIYHVQVSEGRHSHTVAGLVIGAGAGAAIAFIVQSVACRHDAPEGAPRRGWSCPSKGTAVLVSGAGGGLLGALMGKLSKTDRWTRVAVERFPRDH